jgi:hypothetical protein
MQNLQKINVKFYLQDEDSLSAEEAFRIFNAWIASSSDEVLIDVADYSHVGIGPITLLIGHYANYSLDTDGGEKGLLYARKQPREGDLNTRLTDTIKATLDACNRIETEAETAGKVRFRAGDLQIVANDRLQAPNSDEAAEHLRTALTPVLNKLFAGGEYSIERDSTQGQRLNFRIRAQDSFDTQTLLANLAA